jgi:hypothetical protein
MSGIFNKRDGKVALARRSLSYNRKGKEKRRREEKAGMKEDG